MYVKWTLALPLFSNPIMYLTNLMCYRWNMCVEWTNKRMGMAVSSLFVVDHFNHESKEVALEMIHGIRN